MAVGWREGEFSYRVGGKQLSAAESEPSYTAGMEGQLRLRSGGVTTRLALVAAVLVAVSVVGEVVLLLVDDPPRGVRTLVRHVDLSEERNLPTYFSTLLLLSAALLTATIGRLVTRDGGADGRSWYALAVVLAGLSYDEFAGIHEKIGEPLDEIFIESRILWYGWLLPGIGFVVVVGLAFLGFIRRLDPRTRKGFLTAGAVFVGGALGVEVIEAWVAWDTGYDHPASISVITVEETMEMAGMILFIGAALAHLQRLSPSLTVGLRPGAS